MNCYHCKRVMNEKPWIIYGNEDGSVKNICGYICSRRCPDISSYNHKHIVNTEDFNFNLIPIIPKKEELKLVSYDELSSMNQSHRKHYDNHLRRMFEKDENNMKIYEQHMEIELSYKEQEYTTETETDDY